MEIYLDMEIVRVVFVLLSLTTAAVICFKLDKN